MEEEEEKEETIFPNEDGGGDKRVALDEEEEEEITFSEKDSGGDERVALEEERLVVQLRRDLLALYCRHRFFHRLLQRADKSRKEQIIAE